jgi:hypothetical protein
MSTQYRLVQSGKTASGGCSAGPRFVRACSATDLFFYEWLYLAHAISPDPFGFMEKECYIQMCGSWLITERSIRS